MAAGTARIGAMLGQSLADREARGHSVFLQGWHVGRGWRRRRSEHVLKYPLAANHRRGPGRVGGHSQNAPLPQEAPSLVVGAEFDATKPAAVDMGDTVMFGEALVEERIVGLEQVEDAPVIAEP